MAAFASRDSLAKPFAVWYILDQPTLPLIVSIAILETFPQDTSHVHLGSCIWPIGGNDGKCTGLLCLATDARVFVCLLVHPS